MDSDPTDHPQQPGARTARRGSERRPRRPDLPPQEPAQDPSQEPAQNPATADIDPATAGPEEDDEGRLPDIAEESGDVVAEGPLAAGHAASEDGGGVAPASAGGSRVAH